MVVVPGVSHSTLSHFPHQSLGKSLVFGFQGPWTQFENPLNVFEIYSFFLAPESSVTKSQTLIRQKDPIYRQVAQMIYHGLNLTTVMSLIKGPPPMCNQTKWDRWLGYEKLTNISPTTTIGLFQSASPIWQFYTAHTSAASMQCVMLVSSILEINLSWLSSGISLWCDSRRMMWSSPEESIYETTL